MFGLMFKERSIGGVDFPLKGCIRNHKPRNKGKIDHFWGQQYRALAILQKWWGKPKNSSFIGVLYLPLTVLNMMVVIHLIVPQNITF